MEENFKDFNIHQKMEIVIEDMVEKELTIKEALREFEKIYIKAAVKKYGENKTVIARALGIHRNTLNNIMKRLNI